MARSMEALEIPFHEIQSATNNFADENLIAVRDYSPEIFYGTSFSEKIYRGQLIKSEQKIDIVVWMYKLTDDFFRMFTDWKMKLCLLEHENIKSILHFSRENRTTLVLVNKIEANGSLAEHLPGSTLTWKQRLRICIGVAEALKYVHNPDVVEPGHYLIHGNIKSSEILLDENWQPKLQGFMYAMLSERNTLYVTSKYKGTLQYKDPAYENTGGLTDKSDVFSFGVVLFEVLFGRKASTPNEQKDNWNFAEFARLHWENKTLDSMIDPDLRKNMDTTSIKIFSDVAYLCLTGQREERPNMDQVVRALKLSLESQQNHERSMVLVTETSSKHLQGKSFEHLMIPLKDILSATEHFHSKYKIGSGGFGTVYKAKLEHFDSRNPSTVERGDDGGDRSKICSTVAIKRISSTQKAIGEQGFIAEVTMLSNCRHPNIVSLLGFCDEGPEKILIYEYVPNGSLDGYLEHSYRMTKLTWGRRIQICLDIAHGLDYLHSGLNGNERIIHRDIKSANVLLDNNLRAKIADFGLSRLYTIDSKNSTINTINVAGTELYLDPEYMETGKLKTASDIYSFGVVLFEILCGTLAYDRIYTTDTEKGLPSIARRLFKEGKSKAIVDRSIKETDGSIFSHNRGADQQSLDTFLNIANQCLAETQDERPKMKDVISELEKALNFQQNSKDNLQIFLEDINLATQNFSDCNCIGEGKFWKQYKGDVPQAISNAKGCTAIIAKRWNMSGDQGHHQQFCRELEFVFKHKHDNVIDLVGYCTEMEEKIIVYDHSSKGSLDKYLKDISLSWMERLKICIDVASGLEFLHSGRPQENVMMHGDIKSGSILIDGNGKAKISNLELTTTDTFHQETESLRDADGNSIEFLDPSIVKRVSKESDIYSLGVLLFEVLTGRLAKEEGGSLGPLANRWCREGELDEMVVEGVKDQIDPFSFDVFTSTAYSCFKTTSHGQPNASNVLTRLKDALKFQIYIEEIPKTALKDIKLGSDDKCIQEGRYWKLYDAQVQQDNANGWTTVFAKRWDNKSPQAHALFLTELRNLLEYKNKNIVALVGYCNEMNEKIIFYEHASNGSLDKHLDDASFTWKKRLNICIDVVGGLQCLHSSRKGVFSAKHKAIKSDSILIDGDWKGKIANLEYSQPTKSVDVYALGVVLLEILCGRLAWPEGCEDHSQSLGPLAQQHYKEKGNLDELVFKGIEEQIHPASLILFQGIALKCLGNDTGLPLHVVEIQLRKALEVEKYVEGSPQLSFEDIKLGTQNFSDDRCVGEGRYWKLYEGEFPDANADGYAIALVKRWASKSREARHEYLTELGVLSQHKNDDDIVGIEGYCNEMDEKIIVYEHGYNRSLDKHLDDASLSWTKRLNICIDVAKVVHSLYRGGNGIRDIKSGSILIDSDWKGKVSNLELTFMGLTSRKQDLAYYDSKNKYELLVILLEILCGRLDRGEGCQSYSQSLKYLAERHYVEKRNLDELVFEGIKEKIAPESLNLFIEIVGNFLEKRPLPERTMPMGPPLPPALVNHYTQRKWYIDLGYRLVHSRLEQKYVEETPELSLDDVKLATQNFSDDKCVGEGRYWKLYEGEFRHANDNGYTTALVKRWDSKSSQGRTQFFRELRIHFLYKKNENIVAVKGYCSEKDEKIIVLEHAYTKSLDKHLDDTSLSWTKRLNICIDVASVLDLFYNVDPSGLRPAIHGDIKSGSILIDGDWKAKFSNFEVFARDGEWVTDNKAHSSLGYVDPQHQGSGMYKDIYSLGVVLLEMLCGRLAWPEGCEDHSRSLGPSAQRHYKEKGNLDELVFEGIKEQIAPESLIAYQEIALKCIADTEDRQPVGREMVKQLKSALELQEDYEMWNSKLPKEYKEYIQMSKTPEVYSTEVKKDLHDMLTKGILLQQDQLWFTLGANGERNEMISSTKFAYKNRPLRIWQSIPESRFQKVAQMLDISNLKIQIRIKTQFLSPGIDYRVYLVFKICGSRKFLGKRVYVNLSYKRGKDNLHSYFATWRDDEWMMIELCRFSNDKKDVDFEAILKSFSRCYCASRIIYVEGVEFRAIDKVNYVQQVLKSNSHIDEVQQSPIEGHENDEDDKMFSVYKGDGKKHLTLSPIEFLCESSNMKSFDLNPSSVSRSQEVEFLPQQVFGIKCKIESRMLSPDTDYMCYLVFKFSEKCNGLHGPVIIRDLLNWKNKETGILYFRSPSPWNLHDSDWVPRGRKDGWMEVTLWKFNSKSELRNDSVPMNLKLITYNGTMSGLIVCSLEIRPI